MLDAHGVLVNRLPSPAQAHCDREVMLLDKERGGSRTGCENYATKRASAGKTNPFAPPWVFAPTSVDPFALGVSDGWLIRRGAHHAIFLLTLHVHLPVASKAPALDG